jgi:hypothetical protein
MQITTGSKWIIVRMKKSLSWFSSVHEKIYALQSVERFIIELQIVSLNETAKTISLWVCFKRSNSWDWTIFCRSLKVTLYAEKAFSWLLGLQIYISFSVHNIWGFLVVPAPSKKSVKSLRVRPPLVGTLYNFRENALERSSIFFL